MDIEQIKQLIQLMVDNELSELDITDGQNKILLKRGPGGAPMVMAAPAAAAPAAQAAEQLIEVRSPMVGTLYVAASPDSEPFVTEGAAVTEDAVVCIIEAMKVMNEIKAECSGTIQQVCVRNAQPVEYGQVLFRVRPS